MPPTSNESSAYCLLDELLGSKSRVRILRTLAEEADRPLHPTEIAPRSGLSESGTWKGLNRLTRSGLVQERERDGRTCFVLRAEGPMGREVARLFRAERSRGDDLLRSLRDAMLMSPHPPSRALMRDFVCGWPGKQEVGLFFQEGVEEESFQTLVEALEEVAGTYEVALTVTRLTRGETERMDEEGAAVVLGEGAAIREQAPGREAGNGNGSLDPLSPEFSTALASLLERNLSVLVRARENVRGRLKEGPNGQAHELWEWQKVLDTLPFPRLLNFLSSDTPRAARLRECSPFPSVLSEEEKETLAKLAQGVD